jgi:AcrR family transcriptional regulator
MSSRIGRLLVYNDRHNGDGEEEVNDTSPEPRKQMVIGAADMIRRRGLNATSVRELAKHTGAPLGSTYHYFPGGKQQLATEAVRWAGDTVAHMLERRLEDGPVEGLRAFLALWRETITTSDFRAGCPVLAVSVEEPGGGETEVLEAAADVFGTWETLLAGSLRRRGATRRRAAQLATLIVAAVEGTVAMCRAQRSAQPLDDVALQLEALIDDAIKP